MVPLNSSQPDLHPHWKNNDWPWPDEKLPQLFILHFDVKYSETGQHRKAAAKWEIKPFMPLKNCPPPPPPFFLSKLTLCSIYCICQNIHAICNYLYLADLMYPSVTTLFYSYVPYYIHYDVFNHLLHHFPPTSPFLPYCFHLIFFLSHSHPSPLCSSKQTCRDQGGHHHH